MRQVHRGDGPSDGVWAQPHDVQRPGVGSGGDIRRGAAAVHAVEAAQQQVAAGQPNELAARFAAVHTQKPVFHGAVRGRDGDGDGGRQKRLGLVDPVQPVLAPGRVAGRTVGQGAQTDAETVFVQQPVHKTQSHGAARDELLVAHVHVNEQQR